MQPEQRGKRYLDLQPAGAEASMSESADSDEAGRSRESSAALDSSFGGMLQGLLYARNAARDARSLGAPV